MGEEAWILATKTERSDWLKSTEVTGGGEVFWREEKKESHNRYIESGKKKKEVLLVELQNKNIACTGLLIDSNIFF